MRLSICLLPMVVGALATSVNAQSSISVVGRVVDANFAPLNNVKVTLGIAAQPDPRDRIVRDPTNSYGLFQLAKSTVGNFSELYLWIDAPYFYGPTRIIAERTDMWRQKIDDIVLERTSIGTIPPKESAERVAAIYAIEQVKSKLGMQKPDVSKDTAMKLATSVLARCENIQQEGRLNAVVDNAANLLHRENAIFSEAQESLLRLAHEDDFMKLVKVEHERQNDITRLLASYLQGEQPYQGNIATYVNGLNPAAIRPEWFAGRRASERVWAYLRPKSANDAQDLFMLGSLNPEMMGDHVVRWNAGGLHIHVNEPPTTEDVAKWFAGNPNNAKVLYKAAILADPKLPDDRKREIDRRIKAAPPIVFPLR